MRQRTLRPLAISLVLAILACAIAVADDPLRFVYLIQSEQERNWETELPGLLTDASNVDVVELTFRLPSDRAIWYPNSTLSSGRNRMLQHATANGFIHDYYIFSDDDITLEYAAADLLAGMDKAAFASPFRAFEHYLSMYLPAVSAPSYPSWGPSPKPASPVQTVGWFDTLMFAVHRDALQMVLPFYVGWDAFSWWHAVYFFNDLARISLASYNMQINALLLKNDEERHRPKIVNEGFHDRWPWFHASFADGCRAKPKLGYPGHEYFLKILYEPQGDLLSPPSNTSEYLDITEHFIEECGVWVDHRAAFGTNDLWLKKAQFWCANMPAARGVFGGTALGWMCGFPGCMCPQEPHGFVCSRSSFEDFVQAARTIPDMPDLCETFKSGGIES